jgi:hypothetical protein
VASTYAFTKGKAQVYLYELSQDVELETAGEKLAYHSTVGWRFTLEPVAVTAERAELSITILRVQAAHVGPGSSHVVDSGKPPESSGRDDPLLGHLLELEGVNLVAVVDPRSGMVSEVRGGDEIVKRIDQRFPSPYPDEPPPLDAQSKVAYSSAALARMWSEMLALPPAQGGEQAMPLGGPLAGTVVRRWDGSSYALSLPAGVDHLDGRLLKDPTPVTVSLSALDGKGRVQLKDGLPGTASCDLRFVATYNALTQPALIRQRIQWNLRQP